MLQPSLEGLVLPSPRMGNQEVGADVLENQNQGLVRGGREERMGCSSRSRGHPFWPPGGGFS